MLTGHRENIKPEEVILPKDYHPSDERIESIRSSIREHGHLFHTPIVKDNYEIVAGKARVFASRGLLKTIECMIVPSGLDPSDYKRISLHENLKRDNLSWSDQVIMEKELHELRQEQHGEGKKGKKVGWSLRDTAEELNMSFGVLSEDIRMADALLRDPSLARIKDKSTAKKVILENIKRSNQELYAQCPVTHQVNVCLHGGSEQVLKVFPDNVFDACITDPPWVEYKDKSLVRDEFTLPVFKEVWRTLKNPAFLYAFVSTQDWIYYYEQLSRLGFTVQKFPLIWEKDGVISRGRHSWEFIRNYEMILLAVKGQPATTSSMLSSVMKFKIVPPAQMIHPNEKPIDLIEHLLYTCTYEGSVVLDPFAGSFVIPDACRRAGRRYVAIEKDPKYFVQGEERLKK